MADEDKESKTEQPSQKRLDEAREKGNLANSKELGNFLMLLVLAVTISAFLPQIMRHTEALLVPFLSDTENFAADRKGLSLIFYNLAFGSFSIIMLPLLASVVSAIATGLLQHGFVLSAEPIMPKLNKISPMAGLGRIFSMRSLVDFAKNIIKVIVVSIVAFISIYPELAHIRLLPNKSTQDMLLFLWMLAGRMTIGVVIAMFFIALFDVVFQRFQHMKSLRMSKQELKDEYKQSEGDPMVKQRLRRLRMERAQNRMMAAVPKADVVITNPTHFAVALQYDSNSMSAPTVVAKGQDLVAFKIREIAEDNDVPVVENPPLARALFSSTEIDKEIPVTHYEAVAKIISYVYQLKGKK
jgi:flagellar biosynthetic protein FlhB